MYRPPLILSGPSGVGKSYLAHHLASNFEASRIVPTTTRQMRINESDGVDYYFLSEDEYELREISGEMFMSNEFFGARYGFERRAVESIIERGRVPVTEIYTPMIGQFKAAYPDSRAVFLMPDDTSLLVNRMRMRGDPEEKIDYRLTKGLEEIQMYQERFSHYYERCLLVTDDNFDRMVDIIAMNYISKEGNRLYR